MKDVTVSKGPCIKKRENKDIVTTKIRIRTIKHKDQDKNCQTKKMKRLVKSNLWKTKVVPQNVYYWRYEHFHTHNVMKSQMIGTKQQNSLKKHHVSVRLNGKKSFGFIRSIIIGLWSNRKKSWGVRFTLFYIQWEY